MKKEKFDLQLECHHRREKQQKLEVHIAQLEKENEEKDAINEKLASAVEVRDKAIEQAVVKITDLEETVYDLVEERDDPKSMRIKTNYLDDGADEGIEDAIPSSPPEVRIYVQHASTPVKKHRRNHSAASSIVRMPSFITDPSVDTEALRSLYVSTEGYLPRDLSMSSLPRLDEDNTGMNSPRLSILSESSFVSVYGKKNKSNNYNGLDYEESDYNDTPQKKSQNAKRNSVDQWVAERSRTHHEKESQMARRTPANRSEKGGRRKSQFLSINDVVIQPNQRTQQLFRTLTKRNAPAIAARMAQRQPNRSQLSVPSTEASYEARSKEGNPYRGNRKLPPTPETISTNTLQQQYSDSQYNNSNATLQTNVTLPGNPKGYTRRRAPSVDDSILSQGRDKLERPAGRPQAMRLSRPRSAESITSKRTGHGLDTATQSEITESMSQYSTELGSEITSKGLWPTNAKPRQNSTPVIFTAALNPPELFSFTAAGNDWGRQGPEVRERDVEQLIANTKEMFPGYGTGAFQTEQTQSSMSPLPDERSAPLNPPERRSSLAASPEANETRLRGLQQSYNDRDRAEPIMHVLTVTPGKPTIKALLTNKPLPKMQEEEPAKRTLLQRFGIRSASAAVGLGSTRRSPSKWGQSRAESRQESRQDSRLESCQSKDDKTPTLNSSMTGSLKIGESDEMYLQPELSPEWHDDGNAGGATPPPITMARMMEGGAQRPAQDYDRSRKGLGYGRSVADGRPSTSGDPGVGYTRRAATFSSATGRERRMSGFGPQQPTGAFGQQQQSVSSPAYGVKGKENGSVSFESGVRNDDESEDDDTVVPKGSSLRAKMWFKKGSLGRRP